MFPYEANFGGEASVQGGARGADQTGEGEEVSGEAHLHQRPLRRRERGEGGREAGEGEGDRVQLAQEVERRRAGRSEARLHRGR